MLHKKALHRRPKPSNPQLPKAEKQLTAVQKPLQYRKKRIYGDLCGFNNAFIEAP
jgi:hypothetical protein